LAGANHKCEKSRGPFRPLLRWGTYLFFVSGTLAVGYAALILAAGRIYQVRELGEFNHEVVLPDSRVPPVGESIGEIDIPSLALRAVVIQGSSAQVLRFGVGHLYGTPMPGELGNVVLAGHRDTFFRPLRRIRVGDTILLRTGKQAFRYEVESTAVVSPKDVYVLRSSDRNELTLVTCFPFDYVGSAPKRFVVHARKTLVPAE